MDLATILGLIGGNVLIIMSIVQGSPLESFINAPSLLITVGGTVMATLVRFRMGQVFGAVKISIHAFKGKQDKPIELIQRAVEMARIVRREGILALENQEVSNPFFQKGVRLLVDGLDPEFVRKVLEEDMDQTIERHDIGFKVYKAVGDAAPAFGMVGTLIGLVQMLQNMDDPKSIGPAMAVALLTTLYGALIANMYALPMADKLKARTVEETLNKGLIIESITSIQEGRNPRVMEELLKSYLPASQQSESIVDSGAG
jgi:chemotaxis protein MotA